MTSLSVTSAYPLGKPNKPSLDRQYNSSDPNPRRRNKHAHHGWWCLITTSLPRNLPHLAIAAPPPLTKAPKPRENPSIPSAIHVSQFAQRLLGRPNPSLTRSVPAFQLIIYSGAVGWHWGFEGGHSFVMVRLSAASAKRGFGAWGEDNIKIPAFEERGWEGKRRGWH